MTYSKSITKNTLVDYPRLDKIVEFLAATKDIPGVVAEVGVYKGGTAYLICENTPHKRIFLFDTFNGMPAVRSEIDLHHEGDFADTSLEAVDTLLSRFTNYSLRKGIFPMVNSEYIENLNVSFVHIDVDIYDSVRECLEFFTPRMSPGGIIVLDDYLAPTCPGAKQAADEFAALNALVIEPTVQSQAIIRF